MNDDVIEDYKKREVSLFYYCHSDGTEVTTQT